MGLFGKNYNKLLDEALSDYERGDYATCYKKVCEAAENGNGRAYFCQALLFYNDYVNPDSKVDFSVLEELVKKAVDTGYPLAYGFYATLLEEQDKTVELCEFCKQKTKIKDGWYLLKKAAYYFGLYTDNESQADDKTTLETMKSAVELLAVALQESKEKKNSAFYEYRKYSPFPTLSLERLYAKSNFQLMTGYYCFGERTDRPAFMTAFEHGLEYMPISSELLRMIRLYTLAIFKNFLGMKDLNEAHKAMRMFLDTYRRLDEETQALYEEEYDELTEQYEEFCETEGARLANREISYFDGNVDKNDLSMRNIASALSSMAQHMSDSPQSSSTDYYPIGNKTYTKGEQGYLYDSEGFKSGYRIDDVGRLYDENGNELGYYNYKGLFISSK